MIYDVYLFIKKSGCKGGWDAKPLRKSVSATPTAKLHAWNQMCQVGAAQVQAWIGIALNEPHSEVRVHLSTWRYREGLPSTSSSRQISWYEYENWWAGNTLPWLYPTKKSTAWNFHTDTCYMFVPVPNIQHCTILHDAAQLKYYPLVIKHGNGKAMQISHLQMIFPAIQTPFIYK